MSAYGIENLVLKALSRRIVRNVAADGAYCGADRRDGAPVELKPAFAKTGLAGAVPFDYFVYNASDVAG